MTDYEAWRAALVAFYRADCAFQSAENVKRGDPLTISDKRIINAIVVASERRPEAA